jgi:Family of unknown function (DUF6152)
MRSRSSRSAPGLLSLALGVALCSGLGLRGVPPASAHHSFAMYDQTKLVVITGAVKEFQWSNPHALVWLYKDPPGPAPNAGAGAAAAGEAGELWSIELPTSPGVLRKLGWTKHSLEPGDRVAMEINPLRSGEHGGSFKKVTNLKTGEVLTAITSGPGFGGNGGDSGGAYPPGAGGAPAPARAAAGAGK